MSVYVKYVILVLEKLYKYMTLKQQQSNLWSDLMFVTQFTVQKVFMSSICVCLRSRGRSEHPVDGYNKEMSTFPLACTFCPFFFCLLCIFHSQCWSRSRSANTPPHGGHWKHVLLSYEHQGHVWVSSLIINKDIFHFICTL